jgi:hypothetical protein
VAESRLAGDGRCTGRSRAVGVRGRDGNQYFAFSHLRLAPKGQRAYCSVPRDRGKNTTLLSSMNLWGMGPSLALDGPIDREVFEAYVERVLAPTLRVGQVVVMDNLSVHKGERVRKLIEHRGCELLYLCRPTLPGPQPDRGSLLEGQAHPQEAQRSRQGGSDRGDRSSIGNREYRRREGVLRSLWLSCTGPITMKDAV